MSNSTVAWNVNRIIVKILGNMSRRRDDELSQYLYCALARRYRTPSAGWGLRQTSYPSTWPDCACIRIALFTHDSKRIGWIRACPWAALSSRQRHWLGDISVSWGSDTQTPSRARVPTADICIIDRCLVLVINPILIINILEYFNGSFTRLLRQVHLVFYQVEGMSSAYPVSLEGQA